MTEIEIKPILDQSEVDALLAGRGRAGSADPLLRLGDALVEEGLISQEMLDVALRLRSAGDHRPIGRIIAATYDLDPAHVTRFILEVEKIFIRRCLAQMLERAFWKEIEGDPRFKQGADLFRERITKVDMDVVDYIHYEVIVHQNHLVKSPDGLYEISRGTPRSMDKVEGSVRMNLQLSDGTLLNGRQTHDFAYVMASQEFSYNPKFTLYFRRALLDLMQEPKTEG